jgi:hypothetical protein
MWQADHGAAVEGAEEPLAKAFVKTPGFIE